MVKLTKRYRAAQEAADLSKEYTVEEAVGVLERLPKANFDDRKFSLWDRRLFS